MYPLFTESIIVPNLTIGPAFFPNDTYDYCSSLNPDLLDTYVDAVHVLRRQSDKIVSKVDFEVETNLAVTGIGGYGKGLVVNELGGGGADDDFRAETNNAANALVVDASADQVLIGVDTFITAGKKLHFEPDTYLYYDTGSGSLKLYVDGVIQEEWT